MPVWNTLSSPNSQDFSAGIIYSVISKMTYPSDKWTDHAKRGVIVTIGGSLGGYLNKFVSADNQLGPLNAKLGLPEILKPWSYNLHNAWISTALLTALYPKRYPMKLSSSASTFAAIALSSTVGRTNPIGKIPTVTLIK